MNTAASSPAVARLARPSQATLAQKSSCLAGRRLLAADCRKVSVALGRDASVKCVAADEAKPMVGSDPSKLTVSLPAALNIDDIMARLPHRFPFLLVRRDSRQTWTAARHLRRRPRPAGAASPRTSSASLVARACCQVDRIVEWVPGQYAIGIKNVTVSLTRGGGEPSRRAWVGAESPRCRLFPFCWAGQRQLLSRALPDPAPDARRATGGGHGAGRRAGHVDARGWGQQGQLFFRGRRRVPLPQAGAAGRHAGHEGGAGQAEQALRGGQDEGPGVRGGQAGLRGAHAAATGKSPPQDPTTDPPLRPRPS